MPTGSVTPAGSAAFNGGTITTPLRIADAEASGPTFAVSDPATGTGHGVDVYAAPGAGSGTWQLSVWTKSGPALFLENDNLVAPGDSDLIEAVNNTGDVFRVLNDGAVVTGQVAAPADALLNAGQVALWFDQTNGASKLMVKGKSANGTVVAAAIALS